jgi:hypothetical protein
MDLTYYRSVWMGGTLFLAPYDARSQTSRLLAMSTAGAPLAWVLSPSLFASVPLDSQITFLYGTNGALYVDLARTEPCVSDECDVVMVSRDQGATWSPFTPTYRGQRVYLFTALSDERTLIGQTNFSPGGETRTYVRSVDDGATWMSLAPTPGNLVILGLTSSPDGALYAEMWSFGVATATPGIYLLGPGATSWKLVAAPPVSGQLPVLASDARGSPLALWSVGGGADQPPGGLVKYAL